MSISAKQAIAEAQAVLFDFDGVILDSEEPVYRSWERVFKREGQVLPPEIYVKCVGSDFATWSPQTYLEELTGKTYNWPMINAERQVEIESDLANAVAMPGVEKLLEQLKNANKTMAVVSSSTHRWVDGWLDKLELSSFFSTTVCRGDVPKIKPAPDLYQEAARQTQTQPKDCIVIEDSRNGILAAQAAGMKVITVPNSLTKLLDLSNAEWQIESLSDLSNEER